MTSTSSHILDIPQLGVGVGLRAPHYNQILDERPKAIDWFEIISDNYIHAHEGYWQMLSDLRADYPFIMHGVSLSIGATDPIDTQYVLALKKLAEHIDVALVSDHLCFTCFDHVHSHDLLPIPYTQEALAHVIPRIHKVQELLGRALILENASSYLEFDGNSIDEASFLKELHDATGCGVLLDLNNVYVSSFNHNWDMRAYIDAIPAQAVAQYHLGGHTNKGEYCIDTHNAPVIDSVWDLYTYALKKIGMRSTLIEWDADIPPFETLIQEAATARNWQQRSGVVA